MKARFYKFVPDDETATWLHRNTLRFIFWGGIIALAIIAIICKHHFDGADMAVYIGAVLACAFKAI